MPKNLCLRQTGNKPKYLNEILKTSYITSAVLVKIPQHVSIESAIQTLQFSSSIAYAEPNYRYYIQSFPFLASGILPLTSYLFSLTPTDPFYENQWAIRKCLFNAVWDSTIGDSNLVLAILDSGVDTLHPDLQNRIILGYDFVNEDSFAVDDNGHGTQIAGIIGAQANNGEAIAGTDWQTKLLITKVIDAQGMATAFDIAKAIDYAVNHHARIINMSFGGYESSSLIAEAVQNAYNANCVLVAAVGNDRTSLPFYPAANPNVIGVSATKENDLIAEFSNFGSHVDFAAPGASIYTTKRDGGILIVSGTSYACAYLAGAASLILSQDTTLSNAEVYDKLMEGAEGVGQRGKDPQYGWGRINPYYSMYGYPGVLLIISGYPFSDFYNAPGNKFGIPEAGDSLSIRLYLFNYGDSTATNVSATLSCLSPYVTVVNNYVTFPSEGIPGHSQSISMNLFKVYFDKDMPKGSIVPFQVSISSDQGSFVDGFNIKEGDLLSILELSEVDKYIINYLLSFGCRVIVPSRYLKYDYGTGTWLDYAYGDGHYSGGRSAYYGIDPLDNGVWMGGGLDWHSDPMSWHSLTPLDHWPPEWQYLFRQGYEVSIIPEIVAPADSTVYHRGDTINFEVEWTMTYGAGQEQWIEEYHINSADYPPGMHTFLAEGWAGRSPVYDSLSLCVFTFRIRENLVKRYFDPLRPDSARIVYELMPEEYAYPDVEPRPIAVQIKIWDKDNNLVYGPQNLTINQQRNQIFYWDGRDNNNQVVAFEQGPYPCSLTVYYREVGGKRFWFGCSAPVKPLFAETYNLIELSVENDIPFRKNCETLVVDPIYKGHFEGNLFIPDKNDPFADVIDIFPGVTSPYPKPLIEMKFKMKLKIGKKSGENAPWPVKVYYTLNVIDKSGKLKVDKKVDGNFVTLETGEGEIEYCKSFEPLKSANDFLHTDLGHHDVKLKLQYRKVDTNELLDNEEVNLNGLKVFYKRYGYNPPFEHRHATYWWMKIGDNWLPSRFPNWYLFGQDHPYLQSPPCNSGNSSYNFRIDPVFERFLGYFHPDTNVNNECTEYKIVPKCGLDPTVIRYRLYDEDKNTIPENLYAIQLLAVVCAHEELHRDLFKKWWGTVDNYEATWKQDDPDEDYIPTRVEDSLRIHHGWNLLPNLKDTDGDEIDDYEEITHSHHREWIQNTKHLWLDDWGFPSIQNYDWEKKKH